MATSHGPHHHHPPNTDQDYEGPDHWRQDSRHSSSSNIQHSSSHRHSNRQLPPMSAVNYHPLSSSSSGSSMPSHRSQHHYLSDHHHQQQHHDHQQRSPSHNEEADNSDPGEPYRTRDHYTGSSSNDGDYHHQESSHYQSEDRLPESAISTPYEAMMARAPVFETGYIGPNGEPGDPPSDDDHEPHHYGGHFNSDDEYPSNYYPRSRYSPKPSSPYPHDRHHSLHHSPSSSPSSSSYDPSAPSPMAQPLYQPNDPPSLAFHRDFSHHYRNRHRQLQSHSSHRAPFRHLIHHSSSYHPSHRSRAHHHRHLSDNDQYASQLNAQYDAQRPPEHYMAASETAPIVSNTMGMTKTTDSTASTMIASSLRSSVSPATLIANVI